MPLTVRAYGKTDVGLVRSSNEDNLHVDEKHRLFAVCDGMGGHQAGEVASMLAVEILDLSFSKFYEDLKGDQTLALGRTLPETGDVLVKSIRLANRAIFRKASGNQGMQGMGTTVIAAVLEHDLMSIAHVGDSRAYRIGATSLEPLTIDHSWVAEIKNQQHLTDEEASQVVGKNIITRALGVQDTVEVDYRSIRVKAGERFLLCSDGLCGYADDDEIFSALKPVMDSGQKAVDNLIQMANERGGADNVTVVIVDVIDAPLSDIPLIDSITLPEESPELLKAEDDWLGKLEAHARAEAAEPDLSGAKPGRRSLILLVVSVMLIVAVLIIYLGTGK